MNTPELRVSAINLWPERTTFPAEVEFESLLANKNMQTPFLPCRLANVSDPEFHMIAAAILDGLDQLPRRPDRAFEAFWVPVDAEMVRLQELAGPTAPSRFIVHAQHIRGISGIADVLASLATLLNLIPLHTCEYAARTVIDAYLHSSTDKVKQSFVRRVDSVVSQDFSTIFGERFKPVFLDASGDERSANQRNAGRLIWRILRGEKIAIDGTELQLDVQSRLAFYSSTVLPTMRNERFHGAVFASYRSSAAALKRYASDYFACLISFYLLMLSVQHRFPKAIGNGELARSLNENTERFENVFNKYLRK